MFIAAWQKYQPRVYDVPVLKWPCPFLRAEEIISRALAQHVLALPADAVGESDLHADVQIAATWALNISCTHFKLLSLTWMRRDALEAGEASATRNVEKSLHGMSALVLQA